MRLGIVGAGIMGAKVAATAARLPGVEVAAVADPVPARAAALGGTPFTGWRELLDAGSVDAVYLGLPHDAHADACAEATARGVHVLIDKPLCTTVAEADRIIAARDAAGVVVMVGFSYRFRAEWLAARRLVADGAIGEPLSVTDVIAEAATDTPAWYWDAARGGGILHLQSHHCFDRLPWLVGAPMAEVTCRTAGESAAAITATFAGGAVGGISLSFGRTHHAEPRSLTVVQGTAGQLRIEQGGVLAVSTAGEHRVESHAGDDWLHRELAAFVAACTGADTAFPTAEDGRQAVVSAVAATESARTGQPVRLS
ncbi:Gfo/Idh/MocA family oxidoreductase [Dactylosporangium sp. AC04546]|uniref:Gfo/Idh/MocA family protein n=1 Tax=Dactylosporangium sp. AC04546 TaxID=2862460 RepID=UPI001EDF7474|nr:Gfo/Idh/MocA family oxidoreductase [Dactylosporangium sp. AC04546]WVK79594.1 Gfo/Idh/MocA family oxidoreductase [Dactylosporangium sp. AC04546]